MKRRIATVLAGVLLTPALLLTYLYSQFTGMTEAMWHQLASGSMRETYILSSYWFQFLNKLALDNRGFWNFDAVAMEGLNDLEKGKLSYHRGRFREAIGYIERYREQNQESEEALFWLAVCYMREAEVENCLAPVLSATDGHGQFCTLPLTRFHVQPALAWTAANLFEQLLDQHDSSNKVYQWLLNYNYMTVSGFPQEVPAKYRIHSKFIETFYGARKKEIEATYSHLTFEDRAAELGVAGFSAGRGVAVEDYDKDGFLDIIAAGNFEGLRYYKNLGGKTFADITEPSGLAAVKQPFIISAADYDNDGWVDLFVSNPFDRFQLLRNRGDGTFRDVTAEAFPFFAQAPNDLITITFISAWADIDNDGDLDLMLVQAGIDLPFLSGMWGRPKMPSTLFINDRGRFIESNRQYGLESILQDRTLVGAAFGDYDGDGYPDLILGTMFDKGSILLRNVAGRRFEKVDLLPRYSFGFTSAFLDMNHDGRLDIFQGGFGAFARWSTEQSVFGEAVPSTAGHSTIFLQTSDGRFERHDELFDMPMGTMGTSYGDLNNDGCYDFYLGTGTPEGWFVLPNLMYLGDLQGNECLVSLANISMLNGFGTIQKGHGIVFFDFNDDGKQDVYSVLGGMWPGDGWANQFFVNTSRNDNSWVKIRLRGRKTNYFGIGARITVTAAEPDGTKIARWYVMDNKTGFGSAPYLAHIGLLDASAISSIEVYWPASGCRRLYPGRIRELNLLDEQDCLSQ